MSKASKGTRRTSNKVDGPASTLQAMSNRQLVGKLKKSGVEVKAEQRGRGLTRGAAYKISPGSFVDFDPKAKKLRVSPLFDEALIRGTLSIEELFGRIEFAARETLREAGFPDSDELIIRRKHRPWKRYRNGDTPIGVVCRGLDLPLEKTDSVEWYAAAMLRELDVIGSTRLGLVHQKGKTNVLIVVGSSFELGRLVERSLWKFQHEAAAQASYRSTKKRKQSGARGAKANKISADERRKYVLKEAKTILDARPGLSPAAVAAAILRKRPEELARENGKGFFRPSTIAGYIREFQKSGKL